MTSFAGSIGIVGIATILALANGVNAYIRGVEEDTLSLYPLTIQTQGIDLSSILTNGGSDSSQSTSPSDPSTRGDAHEMKMMTRMFSRVGSNDLKSLKAFLDSDQSGIDQYVNSIQYNFNVTPQIFATDTTQGVRQVNPNAIVSAFGMGASPAFSMGMSANVFSSLPDDMTLLKGQYNMAAGRWPENYNECVLVLTESHGVSDFVLYAMGLRDPAELDQMVQDFTNNKPVTIPTDTLNLTYQQLMAVTFKLVNATEFYEFDPTYQVWADRRSDDTWMKKAVSNGETVTIVGVVTPDPSATATMLRPGMYYPASLVHHLMDQSAHSQIVTEQLATPETNIFSGKNFSDEAKTPALADFDFSSLLNVDSTALSQ
jgi:hypothetical protein